MARAGSRLNSRVAAALLCLAAVAAGTRTSDAAFVAQTSNPSNVLASAASFTRDFASGTYTGNGIDSRNITGLAFQPDLVIVKSAGATAATARTRTMTGDVSKSLAGATALSSNMIQSLLADGFQVGTNAAVNTNGTVYQWVAMTSAVGTLSVGSYVGDGSASRSISGLGYSPEAAMVLPADATVPLMRISGMTTSFRFDSATGTASAINSLDADGFTVGNSTSTNTAGTTYHWLTFNDSAGFVKTGSYTGNNTAARSITGVGFVPEFVLVRSSSTTTARAGAWRPAAVASTTSLDFAAVANQTTAITALQTDGFQLGTHVNVNASSNGYSYLALNDPI
ncbi:MAG: hypothetical protein QOI10_1424 [Solirubrobacterales bacterium]|jgi:hypothetical protein|nr:hypothetical protein [Solirubrobacterales bacterium]